MLVILKNIGKNLSVLTNTAGPTDRANTMALNATCKLVDIKKKPPSTIEKEDVPSTCFGTVNKNSVNNLGRLIVLRIIIQ